MNSRTISVPINRPVAEVYEFASNPENLPQWVRSFCQSVTKSGDEWLMETPHGQVGIRFVPANEFGVLDHVVTLPDGRSILNPMRVVANGEGSEVLFTLFQLPEMSDEEFAELLNALNDNLDVSDPRMLQGLFALAPHAAYHLGTIRQVARIVSSSA